MKTNSRSRFLVFMMLLAIGFSAHFTASGQNEYFPATESKPAVLDHIVKGEIYDGYEKESRREFALGKSAFSDRIRKSGGYWYISVYEGFKVTVAIKNPLGNIISQTIVYAGKQKLDIKSKLWEVSGLLEGEITVEKDTRPKVPKPDIHLPPKIKTKPFPKTKPKSARRVAKN